MSKLKLRFITSSLESNHEPMLKFVHACKASGFNFVEVPHSLFKEMRHFRKMLKYGFDHIFMAKHREKVHLSEDSVRESLLDYLEEVERTMVAIKDKLEILALKIGSTYLQVLVSRPVGRENFGTRVFIVTLQ
jgi:hypothetical protein